MATRPTPIPDAVRRSLPVVHVQYDVATKTWSANGHPAATTHPAHRLECVRCQQLVGRDCFSFFGYTVYVPALKRRRVYCVDCVEVETVNETPEFLALRESILAEARAQAAEEATR